MPYVPGAVPSKYSAQYLDFEAHRVADALNVQEAIGGLAIVNDFIQIIPAIPAVDLVEGWEAALPNPSFGDGPVKTYPNPATFNIGIQLDGIYLVNFFLAFDHTNGAEFVFELFRDDVGLGLGSILDSSQQTSASSTSATGIISLAAGNTLDLRVGSIGIETVTWTSGALNVFKLRDLRTRFS